MLKIKYFKVKSLIFFAKHRLFLETQVFDKIHRFCLGNRNVIKLKDK